MKRTLLTPKRLLMLVTAMLLVSSFLGQRTADRISHMPRAAVSTLLGPARWSAYTVARGFSQPERDPAAWEGERMSRVELEELYGKRLRELRDLQREHEALLERLAQLQQIRSLAEQSKQWDFSGVRYVQARVTGVAGTRRPSTLNIAHGTRSGIRENTAVVHGYNLIGRVVHAGPATADVKLITAPGTRLQVRLLSALDENESRDPVPAQLQASEDGQSFRVRLRRSETVKVGDLAHLDDPRYPREAQSYIVGQVVSVEPAPDDPLLFQEIIVNPIPPLAGLSEVTALVPVE